MPKDARVNLRDAPSPQDLDRIALQLGRVPRSVRYVRARCATGWPTVIETEPRLPDGTPFPTFFYLTCKRVNSDISTLESESLMRTYQAQLSADSQLSDRYRRAHEQYLAERDSITPVAEIDGVSAGGMPERVKCLHALVAHSLAVGPGVNPIGDGALAALVERGQWPHAGPCVPGVGDQA